MQNRKLYCFFFSTNLNLFQKIFPQVFFRIVSTIFFWFGFFFAWNAESSNFLFRFGFKSCSVYINKQEIERKRVREFELERVRVREFVCVFKREFVCVWVWVWVCVCVCVCVCVVWVFVREREMDGKSVCVRGKVNLKSRR